MSAGKTVQITLRDSTPADQNWVREFIRKAWGADLIVVHGDSFFPAEMNAIIAEKAGSPVGLATYFLNTTSIEVVTLNSLITGIGIGKKLIRSLIHKAKINNLERIWLITTNDNTGALTFYQKLGFHIVRIYPDAISKSRMLKPEIPLIGEHGIPIRDEIELELKLLQQLPVLPTGSDSYSS
jgi:N-acetylglutamate synthase-like GNAT family acetyltransferase